MIVAIIQARMGSTRLSKKVSCQIAGKSMLARVIERTQRIPNVQQVVVATSALDADRWIVAESWLCGAEAFSISGAVDDVLARYEHVARALRLYPDDLLVRITADCPLLDPGVSGQVIQCQREHEVDYVSNLRDWPDGLDTEVFTRAALREAHHFTGSREDREHVTPWMRRNLFCLELPHEPGLRHYKCSVDTEDDLEYVRDLYRRGGPNCSWEEILKSVICHRAVGIPRLSVDQGGARP